VSVDGAVSIRWERRGRVLEPQRQRPWIVSHAALPVATAVGDGRERVYFSARDEGNRAHIGFCEVEAAGDALRVVSVAAAPVLGPGPRGAFDDAGVTTSCLVRHGNLTYLYYSGWSLGVSVPFYLASGLAVSRDGGRSFERWSPGPLLDRNDVDPFLNASPWVLVDGGRWRMWYVSATAWTLADHQPKHHYHIRYAESSDGVAWTRRGRVAIDYAGADEHALARPCVVKDGGVYRMWFSCRGRAYRLGYAESGDGLDWTRRDDTAGLEPAATGWDSEMIAYPFVFARGDTLHLLYNGNGYGASGFGHAVGRRG
jgi:hypothetical protein